MQQNGKFANSRACFFPLASKIYEKLHLTREQKYEIQTCLKMNVKPAEIARQLGKDRSVISREIKRNSDLNGK